MCISVKRLASKLVMSSVQPFWRQVMQCVWVLTLDTKPDRICHTWLWHTQFDHRNFKSVIRVMGRSQWPRGLRCRSLAARLLRLWVRTPLGTWVSVCCECCILSGRGLCDALITRPEEFYRLWCVVVCDLETSRMRRPWSVLGRSATGKKKYVHLLVCN